MQYIGCIALEVGRLKKHSKMPVCPDEGCIFSEKLILKYFGFVGFVLNEKPPS